MGGKQQAECENRERRRAEPGKVPPRSFPQLCRADGVLAQTTVSPMKSRSSASQSFLIPVLVLALAGCASSPISRIDANREKYQSWPLEVQEAVLAGEARKGMTPEQVEVAMGKPSEVVTRSAGPAGEEVWIYRSGGGVGSGLLSNTGISVGAGTGGVSVGTSTGIGGGRRGRTPEEREVVFVKGVVVRADPK